MLSNFIAEMPFLKRLFKTLMGRSEQIKLKKEQTESLSEKSASNCSGFSFKCWESTAMAS